MFNRHTETARRGSYTAWLDGSGDRRRRLCGDTGRAEQDASFFDETDGPDDRLLCFTLGTPSRGPEVVYLDVLFSAGDLLTARSFSGSPRRSACVTAEPRLVRQLFVFLFFFFLFLFFLCSVHALERMTWSPSLDPLISPIPATVPSHDAHPPAALAPRIPPAAKRLQEPRRDPGRLDPGRLPRLVSPVLSHPPHAPPEELPSQTPTGEVLEREMEQMASRHPLHARVRRFILPQSPRGHRVPGRRGSSGGVVQRSPP
ncbi:hypothetical protein VTN02DRAFT_1318 [Thermoascus thermophilus]